MLFHQNFTFIIFITYLMFVFIGKVIVDNNYALILMELDFLIVQIN